MLRISRFLAVVIAEVHLLQRPKGYKELGVNTLRYAVGNNYFLSCCCEFWGPDFLVCLVDFFTCLFRGKDIPYVRVASTLLN